jgi:hypothetical protein
MANGSIFPRILTVTLDGSDCLILCRDSFIPCERISAANWIGKSRSGLFVEKEKYLPMLGK